MKKSFAALTVFALALSVSLIFGLVGRYSASANSNFNSSLASLSSAPIVAQQAAAIASPNVNIYALNADNVIFVLTPGATGFVRLVRVNRINGTLIGLDFRPADGAPNSVYGLTDTGNLYTINLSSTNLGAATLVSTQSPRFAGGFQSLMDFNPVVNALRLIGTNDQNFALVNSGGNLNVTAVQSPMSYNTGDVNGPKTAADGTITPGVDPNITGGSYTNNYVGAPFTIFYGIDYDLDTLVTIAPASPGCSSATGGGKLQTVGRVSDSLGNLINFSPTTDFDIYTDGNGANHIIGMSGRTMFSIDLSQINSSLALGATQKVVANAVTMAEPGGGYIDIAVASGGPTPAPAPAPTATPTPSPTPAATTKYEAENALLGGGSKVATNNPGFTGTGFVDFADNVAGSFVEFSVSQTGARTLKFRYANGSTVNRPCKITVNGTVVGTLNFAPTGAWTTYSICSLSNVNLGAAAGNKAVRVTSTTAAGGPNLDNLVVQ